MENIFSSVHLVRSEGDIQFIPFVTLNPDGAYRRPEKLSHLPFVSLLHGFIWAKLTAFIKNESESVIQIELFSHRVYKSLRIPS